MKKFLFYILFLLLGHVSFCQTYLLELKADGKEIPEANALEKEDVVWSVTAPGKIATDVEVYAIGMGDFVSNYLMFDINYWTPAPAIGQELIFTVTVISGPYAGYSGTKVYVINGGNVDDFLPGGLNLVHTSKPKNGLPPAFGKGEASDTDSNL